MLLSEHLLSPSICSGSTGADEMCNLYLMYYSYSKEDTFKVCFDEQVKGLNKNLPEGNDVFLCVCTTYASIDLSDLGGVRSCADLGECVLIFSVKLTIIQFRLISQ